MDRRSSDDVVVIDEPASTTELEAGTRHSRAFHETSAASAAVAPRKQLLVPPSTRPELCRRHTGATRTSDDVINLVSHVPDEVVYCDEDSHDAFPDTALQTTSTANPASTAGAFAAAVETDKDDDEDVLICDTPAPNQSAARSSNVRRHVIHPSCLPDIYVPSSVSVCRTVTHRHAGPSMTIAANRASSGAASTTVPSQDVSVPDGVVLVEDDSEENLSLIHISEPTRPY